MPQNIATVLDADQTTRACETLLRMLPEDWISLAVVMGPPYPPWGPAIMAEVISHLRNHGLLKIRKNRRAFEIRKAPGAISGIKEKA